MPARVLRLMASTDVGTTGEPDGVKNLALRDLLTAADDAPVAGIFLNEFILLLPGEIAEFRLLLPDGIVVGRRAASLPSFFISSVTSSTTRSATAGAEATPGDWMQLACTKPLVFSESSTVKSSLKSAGRAPAKYLNDIAPGRMGILQQGADIIHILLGGLHILLVGDL